ncbi:hypothetical protein BC936DRAFT_139286 [Jimgerdemannia flammicorona]|uniref:Uncharacterized protein n=1 Tax=Jimgerdemannia flammicorona TaxID=994334 RepID=A0A433BA75_9FUNG|nr:hypothetical protein BC936DRAFT_139286 [Jimgerdemannia flammicorona]
MYSATHTADRLELKHKLLLVGHKSAVMALCLAQQETEMGSEDILISASEDGSPGTQHKTSSSSAPASRTRFAFLMRHHRPNMERSLQLGDMYTLLRLRYIHHFLPSGHPFLARDDPIPNLTHSPVLGRRRLLTVTFDGALDLWDFNPHDLVVTRDYTPLEPLNVADEVLDLKSSNFDGELVMALTRTCALVLQGGPYRAMVIQFAQRF